MWLIKDGRKRIVKKKGGGEGKRGGGVTGSGLQEDVRILNGWGEGGGMVTYKYKSSDTRTREKKDTR